MPILVRALLGGELVELGPGCRERVCVRVVDDLVLFWSEFTRSSRSFNLSHLFPKEIVCVPYTNSACQYCLLHVCIACRRSLLIAGTEP